MKSPWASFLQGTQSVSKAIVRATEMSHLKYSTAEYLNLARTLLLRGGKETKLLDYRVAFLDLGSFKIVVRDVFIKGEYYFVTDNDTPVILDCGANIGLATLFFKRWYPRARIKSFEADPTTADVLRNNVRNNGLEDVMVYNLLLSDQVGDGTFYVSADVPGSLQMSTTRERFSTAAREIKVPSGKLSDFIDGPVDFLKLDIEGAEFAVMHDLVESGKIAQISRMVIEYHHKMGAQQSQMASFLSILEVAGFEYQLHAKCEPITSENLFQDIMIGAYRPASPSARATNHAVASALSGDTVPSAS
jgi:FkbM family methyltransferase